MILTLFQHFPSKQITFSPMIDISNEGNQRSPFYPRVSSIISHLSVYG
uniref:Uncharacterized protein n=1 Tax=Lepeophtheirus salmonis TaxID=72036 RepID=A0A0K2UM23_LEPSM